jgi:hypothetical protein
MPQASWQNGTEQPKKTPDRFFHLVPTVEEIAPWIDIIRLWDDHTFYEQERRRCLAAGETWRPERLLPPFEEMFKRFRSSANLALQ